MRSERESQALQIAVPFAQRRRFFCSLLLRLCSSWAKSSGPKRHFSFSAISRKIWLRRSPRADEMNSLVLPDSTTQPHARGSPTPTPPQPSRPRGLTGATLAQPRHRDWLRFYRQLLKLQMSAHCLRVFRLACAIKADYEVHGDRGLTAHWDFPDRSKLILLANLGTDSLSGLTPPASQIIYASEEVNADALEQGTLPAWSVVWFLEIMKPRSHIPRRDLSPAAQSRLYFRSGHGDRSLPFRTRHQSLLHFSVLKGSSRKHARIRHRGSQLVKS